MDKLTSLSGGTGTRLSTWNDPDVRAQFQYYEEIEAVHRNVESPPPIPEYPALNTVLSEMSWSAVQGHKTVERALEDAAQECESILAASGYYD
jgi:multiple sugar transport system substrate-binding protein